MPWQPETIARALRSNVFDAVICTVSGGRADLAVESEGTINVIKAAEAAKVPRFILVSQSRRQEKTIQQVTQTLKLFSLNAATPPLQASCCVSAPCMDGTASFQEGLHLSNLNLTLEEVFLVIH